MALGFVSVPIMIRQLGSEMYGILALLTSLIAPLGLLDLGIGEATVKFISESLGRGDLRAAERYLRATCFFNLSVGGAGAVLVAAFAPFLVHQVFRLSPDHEAIAVHCLYGIGAIWCINQVRQTFVGAVTARQNYKVASIGTFCTQFAHTGLGIVVLLSGGSLVVMVAVQALSAAVSVFAWVVVARRVLPGVRMSPAFSRESFRHTSTFGLWQMLNNLCGLVTHQSQRWLLGALLPVAAVGHYNAGAQLVTMVYSAASRVGQVLFPAVSQLQGQQRDEEAARLVVQSNWFLTGVVVSGFVSLAVFADGLLGWWVGAEFAARASDGLRVLCLGYAIASTFSVPNFFLLGTGRPQWLTWVSLAQGIITLSLAVGFIQRWGVAGAAAAVSCGTLAQAVTVVVIWKRLFARWISLGAYLSANFGPLLTALAVGALSIRGKAMLAWNPEGRSLAVATAGCMLLTWTCVQLTNLALPEGGSRWQAMWRTGSEVLAGMRRRVRLAGP